MINSKYNENEKMIIENEMKFCINKKSDFAKIYSFLNEKYIVMPYKNAYLCDYYYDTKDRVLLENGISYRIRFRPKISINLKLEKEVDGFLWSRHEYSYKLKGKKNLEEIKEKECFINQYVKEFLDTQSLRSLNKVATISTFRVGFNVFFSDKDMFENYKYLGLCFFDVVYNKNEILFYEFEMEAYQQRDSYVSPKIFKEFAEIGNWMEKTGFLPSSNSKIEKFLELSAST